MKKKHKIFIAAGILFFLLIGGLLYLNTFLKNEIKQGLENEYSSSALSYDEISVNAFAGNATIKNVKFHEGILSLESEEVNLKDFSYSDYLENKNLTIGGIHFINPSIVLNRSDTIAAKDVSEKERSKQIKIKSFTVTGGNLRIIDNDSAANSLYTSINNLHIEQIEIGKKHSGGLLPFEYQNIDILSDSVYYEMNETHYMQAGELRFENEDLNIGDLSIIPKYSKESFDKLIPYEQDWIALKVESISLSGVKFGKDEEITVLEIPTTTINKAHLEIYRNKLLPDDTRIKPMYSEMLRNIGFQLHIGSLNISNSYIEYQEKVLETRPAGELNFHNVKAEITNISNRNMDSQDFSPTVVRANALFMGESKLSLDWRFDVSNERDEFQIKGSLDGIRAEHINSFLTPAMNIEAEGDIQSLFYDFYGNRNQANGNMQLSYKDFNVKILKDGEDKSKSLLSKLANLVIKNDRINEDVKQENINTTRDKTKSFWNFFWLCIRDGALSTFF